MHIDKKMQGMEVCLMKNWAIVCLTLALCAGILMYVSADVNEGHGPGYVAEEQEGGHH